jgi:hypothetical protein
VRKISGFRAPAGHNAEAFAAAVEEITAASTRLLAALEVRSTAKPATQLKNPLPPVIPAGHD